MGQTYLEKKNFYGLSIILLIVMNKESLGTSMVAQ